MRSATDYDYINLTHTITDKASPLRQYMDVEFPNRSVLQAAYRESGRPLRVPGGESNPGTIGAAFDFVVRMVLDPKHVPLVALAAFMESPADIAIVREVVTAGAEVADCRDAAAPEVLLRVGWALALCTEVYRIGGIVPGSPLASMEAFTADNLLALATPDALRQLGDLHCVAREYFYPFLPHPALVTALGPTFDASRLCKADADVIVDGQLIELKTRLGTLNKRTNQRSDALGLEDIYQLLGYALFDRTDRYGINAFSIYSARYGNLLTWPMNQYLSILSGRSVDIGVERERVWTMLGGV